MTAPSGLTGQTDVTGDLTLDCGVVIIGSGPAGRPQPPNWPKPEPT